jgi:catechol 2,3-dioxygenase-like lactoylglutathione lyase family enzyme
MVDFDNVGEKVLSPTVLAHVVLRTSNLERMVDFYTTFLGGTITHRNEMLAFITYDHEHHRIALIGIPDALAFPIQLGLRFFVHVDVVRRPDHGICRFDEDHGVSWDIELDASAVPSHHHNMH